MADEVLSALAQLVAAASDRYPHFEDQNTSAYRALAHAKEVLRRHGLVLDPVYSKVVTIATAKKRVKQYPNARLSR
jgi:hypothetical protein